MQIAAETSSISHTIHCVHLDPNQPTAVTTVEIAGGSVVGLEGDTFRSFRGIPFAQPPLGSLRFAPPLPAKPWKPNTLQATDYKKNCLQNGPFDPPIPAEACDEDCLYLNVW